MPFLTKRLSYLFTATKGLVLVAIALVALTTVLMGTLSGPMREWGITEVVIDTFGLRMVEAEREGRIVLLYHAIAVAVVAIETYLITGTLPMKPEERVRINGTITVGYLLTLFFGLIFGYFGHNWIAHGLFIAGLTLAFFAGSQLAVALWPWRKADRVKGAEYARWGRIDLERAAFFVMTMSTLVSASLGAVTGAFYGNGQETFLAENIVRNPFKTPLELAIIGHLHIMLTLIAIALALLVGRWLDFKGLWHKLAMPLFIVGTLVTAVGAWSVVVTPQAHAIIYVGSTIVLLGALFLVIFGFDKLIRDRLTSQGITKATLGQKLGALLHDPLKFGALWQMVFMNFVVSFPGIFMAAKLEETFRVWPLRQERLILTGHWHVLSGLVATILLLLYADLAGLKGRTRQVFGWVIIGASDLAFAATTAYTSRRLFVTAYGEGPLVATLTLLMDAGLGLILMALGALMGWRLIDLFKNRGRWHEEAGAAQAQEAVL
ncbi:MAG: hypothetical protein JXC32_19250 [Anaerolineae bacterium]|nr:hypothetical protein [Anaerolineae bacterium]